MQKQTTRLWIMLALAVCSWLTTGCHTASLRPSEMVADSISGFSAKQGANGWSYGYWDRAADTDKSYRQTTDFQLLRHFASDPINQLSNRPELVTGKMWTLQDRLYSTALWAEGGSANGTWKIGGTRAQVEHWAVRRWLSTVNGPVTISGHAAKIMDWGDADSGQAHIVVDGAMVFSSATHRHSTNSVDSDMRGTNYSVNATVHIGSLVDFLINAGPTETGGAFGPVKFTATIRAAPAPDPYRDFWTALVRRVYQAPDGFHRLSPREQTYFSVRELQKEVYNRGMYQFFYDSSGDRYAEMLRGLEELGAMRSHALLKAACRELFPGGEPPRDTAARCKILSERSHDLADLEKEFWSDPDKLGDRLRKYALDHQLVRPAP